MDEPVRHLVEGDLDFSPQCSDVRQLMDSSFLIEQDLAEALRLRTLRVEYQPQFDLSNGQGCGVEALARWVRSTGEIIAPSVFIRLAERSGLIRTLGEWVLQSACATAGAWCSRPAQQTTLSVNVSALQIDEEFCGVIERTLKKTGFPAKQLELEITESALMADPALSIDYLKAWKQLGVRIAMDDFGTGYSSLSSLSRLPVDRLKLDRSLIHRMTLDRKGAAVVRLIISLGAELDVEVIAEGVETEEQLRMLKDLGCPQAQGYLLGRPMAAEQIQEALDKMWGNRAIPPSARSVSAVGELQRNYRSAAFSKRFTMRSFEALATRRVGSDA
jgi:diguanylate cyclase